MNNMIETYDKPEWSRAQLLLYNTCVEFGIHLTLMLMLIWSAVRIVELSKTSLIAAGVCAVALFYSYALGYLLLGGAVQRAIARGARQLTGQARLSSYQQLFLAHNFIRRSPGRLMVRSPLGAWYYRWAGAKVGGGTIISDIDALSDPWLMHLGKDCTVGQGAQLFGHCQKTSGKRKSFVIGSIHLGDGVLIGSGCIVWPGVTIGSFSTLLSGSVVAPGTVIPPHEVWGGAPARFVKRNSITENEE